MEHVLGFNMSRKLQEPRESTRNNSTVEALMLEDITIADITDGNVNLKEKALKYTCIECKFITVNKDKMDIHVMTEHESSSHEEPTFFCNVCKHEFNEVINYNSHIIIHDETQQGIVEQKNQNQRHTKALEDDSISDDLNKVQNTLKKEADIAVLENLIYCEILECFVGTLHVVKEEPQSVYEEPQVVCDETHSVNKEQLIDDKEQQTVDRDNIEEYNTSQVFLCENCKYVARNKEWLEIHKRSNHGVIPVINQDFDELVELTCRLCVFEGKGESEIDNHMQSIHKQIPFISCTKCEYKTQTKTDLEKHVQTIHMIVKVNIQTNDQIAVSCELCEYKCRYNIQLMKHMKSHHEEKDAENEMGKYKCVICEFTANFLFDMWQHRHTKHADATPEFLPKSKSKEDVAFAYLAEQMLELTEEMETLKKDCKGAFEALANIMETQQNTVREEATTNYNTIIAAIAGLGKQFESSKINQPKKQNEEIPHTNHSNIQEQIPNSNIQEQIPKPSPPPTSSPPLPPSTSSPPSPPPTFHPPRSEYKIRTKVLYVGDSVGRNVRFPIVEKVNKCSIKTAKAYSSAFDKTAMWPESNFTEVVKKELQKKTYDCLVMSAPTVDITNLDTSKLKHSDNTTIYQQKVLISCQNMFNAAKNSLQAFPSLKQVILMEHAQRYDSEDIDPIRLKTALVKYANNVLNQLWLDSPLKNKICIGNHSLENGSSGSTHDEMFMNVKTGNYDGVHHYGIRGNTCYTKSVSIILQKNLKNHQNDQHERSSPQYFHQQECPQAVHQKKQIYQNGKQTKYHPSVKNVNRFSVFNSNLGNL